MGIKPGTIEGWPENDDGVARDLMLWAGLDTGCQRPGACAMLELALVRVTRPGTRVSFHAATATQV